MRILLAMLAVAAMLFVVACGDDDGGATCKSNCEATIAANCSSGPATQAACESDCDSALNGSCGTEFQGMLDCADGKSVTCDASGIPSISGCDTQMDAYTTCLTQ